MKSAFANAVPAARSRRSAYGRDLLVQALALFWAAVRTVLADAARRITGSFEQCERTWPVGGAQHGVGGLSRPFPRSRIATLCALFLRPKARPRWGDPVGMRVARSARRRRT